MVMSWTPRRLVNQLESGTSPSVLTFNAGPRDFVDSPKVLLSELVALREVEPSATGGMSRMSSSMPDRIVGIEASRVLRRRRLDWAAERRLRPARRRDNERERIS